MQRPPPGGDTSNVVVFPPLKNLHQEIRLLELLPAKDPRDAVSCRLVTAKMSSGVEYIGLSTLYERPEEQETLFVDGCELPLAAHVVEALRNMRTVFLPDDGTSSVYSETPPHTPKVVEEVKPTKTKTTTATTERKQKKRGTGPPRWLKDFLKGVQSILPEPKHRTQPGANVLRVWLDILCVNRRNPREEAALRSHKAMAYRSAQMVVGWLGPKTDLSDLSVAIIEAWNSAMPPEFGEDHHRRSHPEAYGPQLSWMGPIAHTAQVDPSLLDNPSEAPAFRAMDKFYGYPYFQRSWILGEMVFARFPAFLLGDLIVSWMHVLKLTMAVEEVRDHGAELLPGYMQDCIATLPLECVYALLKDYEARQRELDDPAVYERAVKYGGLVGKRSRMPAKSFTGSWHDSASSNCE